MQTRYRILFNGIQHKIQYQQVQWVWFGLSKHWQRKWTDYSYVEEFLVERIRYYGNLDSAISKVKELQEADKVSKKWRRHNKKIKQAMKNNIWKKVWP